VARIEVAQPLGALLDAVVQGLRASRLTRLPLACAPFWGNEAVGSGAHQTAASVCPAGPCGRLLELALGEKSPRTRRPTAPGLDIPTYAGHRDRLRPRRAIGSTHHQTERFRAKSLQGERDGL
jgi:hypothetical protein